MGIANLHDYLARVEQAVRDNLRGAQVMALMQVETTEREGYWERIYLVAWYRADQCGTHRVNIDSEDRSACFIGHYDMREDQAMEDFVERAFAGILGGDKE